MKKTSIITTAFSLCSILLVVLFSCSKGGSPAPPPAGCSNVTITVSATSTNAAACMSTGSITVTASGSSNLSYSIDGTTFQASNVFNNIAKGNYTVTVKNSNNCSGTAAVSVNESGTTPGPLFTAVKTMMQANCVSCHQPGGQMPSLNFLIDCNIVQRAATIKTRAVDQGTMPPTGALPQTDKDKITAWINAGAKIEN